MASISRSSSVLRMLPLLAACLLASGCAGGGEGVLGGRGDGDRTRDTGEQGSFETASGVEEEVAAREGMYDAPPQERLEPGRTYVVHVKTTKGSFDIVLDQESAPVAAANFAFLVREGFYDGVIFHRVIDGFMVQTGDPSGTGTGGPGYAIEDDPVEGSYSRGVVAMANAGPGTAGSQFFIVQGTEVDRQLGKDYAIFGRVDEQGMRVVDEIAAVDVTTSPNGERSQPTEPVLIEEMELEEG